MSEKKSKMQPDVAYSVGQLAHEMARGYAAHSAAIVSPAPSRRNISPLESFMIVLVENYHGHKCLPYEISSPRIVTLSVSEGSLVPRQQMHVGKHTRILPT